MTLDARIQKDLIELYNGGATPGDIIDALSLHGLIAAKPGRTSFATRALPGYYAGDRKAKTVMVMLNPGMDVAEANCNLKCDICKRSMKNARDIAAYHKWCENYGHLDKFRFDNFDVKQAFFLKNWPITKGFSLPVGLSSNPKSNEQTLLDAKEIVLTKKLQLELIPYASSSFKLFNWSKVHLVFPFVDTILDEIFSHDREYVIFCSQLFNRIFKEYEKTHKGTVNFLGDYSKVIPGSKITGTCTVLDIHYGGSTIKSIIANTFPHQALPNAYELMEKYGEFCYNCL